MPPEAAHSPAAATFLTTLGDGSLALRLHVQPRAARTRLVGIHGDALKLAVTAPPVGGKANGEVIAFLASFFKVAKKEITITGGLQSREKRCRIGSLSESDAKKLIFKEIGEP